MNYSDIIKRAWHITWRYKALWVLGIFAGVSGCQPGGGGNGGSSNYSFSDGQATGAASADFDRFIRGAEPYIPALIALAVFIVVASIIWSIFSIAARGGLIAGADAADKGAHLRLGELWAAGFSHFWGIVGLGIVLQLPVIAIALLLLVFIFVPILGSLFAGGEPGPEVLAPICGSFAIGLPVLIVLSFILGILYLIALRYIVLGRQGVFESIRNSWAFFRARFKHTALMWLISAGLNLVASFVLAIPIVVVSIALIVPAIAAGASEQIGTLVVLVVILFAVVFILSLAYSGVWGTFSSALWTAFFRDVTGMSEPIATGVGAAGYPPTTPQQWPEPPQAPQQAPEPQPGEPEPPAPPAPPAPADA